MLNIYFNEMPQVISNTSVYFNNIYFDHWIFDDFAKKDIKAINKGEVVCEN